MSNDNCATHMEFSRRLDDRWREHLDLHGEKQDEVCDKFRGVFERLDKLNQKVNWLLGGVAVMCPLFLLFIQLLLSHIGGKP